MFLRVLTILLLFVAFPAGEFAAADGKDNLPILRLNAGGPLSTVTALGFSADGKVLYAAGRDKIVHAWVWQETYEGDEQFVYRPELSWRIPIGPRDQGLVNTIAISDDGRLIAVAGKGRQRDARVAGLRDAGLVWPAGAMTEDMWLDEGRIHVFDTQTRQAKSLRGHRGTVTSLRFAPSVDGQPPILVSAGEETKAVDDADGRPRATKFAVRVWNVETRGQIAAINKLFPPQRGNRPGLSVWRTGNGNDVRIAIAWNHLRPRAGAANQIEQVGFFGVWDTGTRGWRLYEVTHGNTFNALRIPGSEDVITAAWNEFELWRLPPAGQANLNIPRTHDDTVTKRADNPNRAVMGPIGEQAITRDAALLKSRAGIQQPFDHAAFVLAESGPNGSWDVQLQLIDLNSRQLLPSKIKLWNGAHSFPVVAADPTGEFVAVSGKERGEIRVYRAADLLNGRATLVEQPLHGAGLAAERVAFAKRGDDLGLLLDTRTVGNGVATESQVFNITGRDLSSSTDGWEAETPPNGGWTASATDDLKIAISRNGTLQRTLDLEQDREIDPQATTLLKTFPICAATAHCPVPIMAVATQTNGFPRLSLYNLQNGEELRRYNGHVEPIVDMAFSADGRLLATAAADRTVRVWWLADMAQTLLGQRGLIRDVAFDYRNGAVEVSQGQGALTPGTRITGVVQKNEFGEDAVQAFASLWDFYWFVSLQKPGQVLSFQVAGAPQPLQVVVGQAIDERKPLFSLFFPNAQEPTWIGWHPVGKYDARGRDAELSLGWHFNTGLPRTPTRYASSREYHDQNFAPNLLTHLVEHGTPPIVKPPTPEMSLEILAPEEGLTEYDPADRQLITRTSDLTAVVEILQEADDDEQARDQFPVRNVKSLQWRLGDGEFQDFQLRGRTWEADLSTADWSSSDQRTFQVRLITVDDTLPPFEESVPIRYQPPPPEIELEEAASNQRDIALEELGKLARVNHPDFEFLAEIINHAGEVNVTVHQYWEADGEEKSAVIVKDRVIQGEHAQLKEKIVLKEGVNRIEVTAVNRTAQKKFAGLETARRSIRVKYVPVGPPVIQVTRIAEVGGRSDLSFPDGTLIVSTPKIKIAGTIKVPMQGELQKAEIVRSTDAKQFPALPLKTEGRGTFNFEQVVDLDPGDQKVSVQAESKGGKPDAVELQVIYLPKLPELTRTLPESSEVKLVSPQKKQVEIKVSLMSPDGVQLADQQLGKTSKIRVNGTAVDQKFDIKIDAQNPRRGELSAIVPLEHGENVIEVELRNQWGGSRYFKVVTAKYVIPPKISQLSFEQTEENKSRATAAFVIESPEKNGQPAIALRLNGKTIPKRGVTLKADPAQPGQWRVHASGISLSAGVNRLEVYARTVDGDAQEASGNIEVRTPPPQPRPIVRILSPASNSAIQTERLDVTVQVQSESRVTSVDLLVRQDGWAERIEEIELPDQRKDALGKYNLILTKQILLEPGSTSLSARATNAGGSAELEAPVYVNVMPQPVRISLEQISVPAEEPQELHATFRDGRHVFSGAAGNGHVQLHGKVNWPKDQALLAPQEDNAFVKVSVNGFAQRVPLSSIDSEQGEAKFAADVILSRKQGNLIRVELPEKPNESMTSYFVDCEKPEERQRLHIVVFGVVKDEESNENLFEGKKWLNALSAALGREPGNSAFTDVLTYRGPLVGEQATYSQLRRRFYSVRKRINQFRAKSKLPPNDLVIVYYHGKEVAREDKDDVILATSDNWAKPRYRRALTGTRLFGQIDDLPGAHWVLWQNPEDENSRSIIRRMLKFADVEFIRVSHSGAKGESDLVDAIGESLAKARSDKEVPVYLLGLMREDLQSLIAQRNLGFYSEQNESLSGLPLLRPQE